MNKRKKTMISLFCVVIALCVLAGIIAFENKHLETNCYTIENDKIPESFDSFKIAQISDLHNEEIGKDNEKLIAQLKSATPDIIVVTGDLIDSRKTDVEIAVKFMKEAVKIAPCYYVNGNHEIRVLAEYEELKNELYTLGVTILENNSVTLKQNDESITIMGINDSSSEDVFFDSAQTDIETPTDDSFTILLSHRPELFELYTKYDYDLVFTGHAHGGQFRLPFVGGLYAPHQGFLPEYDSGLYEDSGTTMLVSRGVGNSIFPFRFNNRPEIIVAELKAQ